jgi:hypothetical protein
MIKVGDWIQDCDPRYFRRKVRVHTIETDGVSEHSFVTYFNGRHNFKIRADRIKPADYAGRKGWKLTTRDAT